MVIKPAENGHVSLVLQWFGVVAAGLIILGIASLISITHCVDKDMAVVKKDIEHIKTTMTRLERMVENRALVEVIAEGSR